VTTRKLVNKNSMRRTPYLLMAVLILLLAAGLRIVSMTTYPAGPHYDEAVNLLIVRSIAFGGARFFPMVEAYQGREVLYHYLMTPLIVTVQDSMFSIHLTSVFASMITLAAAIGLGRAMFPGARGLSIGIAVGVLMLASFPQLWLGRQAFRAVTLPMMQALSLLFLFRGMTMPKRAGLWLIAGGFFAGGALYTYNASRLFPLWVGIGLLVLVITARFGRPLLARALIFGGALTITAAPMVAYAFVRPDVFFGRLGEVTQPEQSITLAESLSLHARMFFLQGDPYFRYNLAGRPYFSLPEGALLLIGVVACALALFRRSSSPTLRMGYVLALLSPLMIIPSVISVGGLPPSHMRSLGMVPLIFVLVALGGEALYHAVGRILPLTVLRSLLRAAVVAAPLVAAAVAAEGYRQWIADGGSALYFESDAQLGEAARWASDHVQPGETIYFAARDKGHPTVLIENLPKVRWTGTDSFFLPPSGQTAWFILPARVPITFAPALLTRSLEKVSLGADSVPYVFSDADTMPPLFEAYRITGNNARNDLPDTLSPRNPYLRSEGAEAEGLSVPSGGEGWITTRWRVLAPPDVGDFTPLLQVEDAQGTVYFRGDAYMTETDRWRTGETLFQALRVALPPAMPPGAYRLRMAWVARATDRYASYMNADGTSSGIWADVGTLTVTSGDGVDESVLAIENRWMATAAPSVTFLGSDSPPSPLRPGDLLPMTLYWRAEVALAADFALAMSLRPVAPVGSAGDTVLWQGTPIAAYPPSAWQAGEVLAERARWRIPIEVAAGDYQLIAQTDTMEIALGTVAIAAIPRLFVPPPMAQTVPAVFGDSIALVGYTLRREAEEWALELVWRAERPIERDFKVFVHLVDANGAILAQRDAFPMNDRYPHSLWLPDEIVVDTYHLPAISGGAELRIGLYDPQTAQRLILLGNWDNFHIDYMAISDLINFYQ